MKYLDGTPVKQGAATMSRERALERYRALAARVDAWERSERQRARAEAERVVGWPFDGCSWHNARIAYESGKPWEEFGQAAYKAMRRFEHRERVVWDTAKRLSDAFWARCCEASGWAS
jgi:hypothetical protein